MSIFVKQYDITSKPENRLPGFISCAIFSKHQDSMFKNNIKIK